MTSNGLVGTGKEFRRGSLTGVSPLDRLLFILGDVALVDGAAIINKKLTEESLVKLKVDEYGLDQIDIEYLKALIEKFNGGPVGVETIATSIGEEVTTIEDVVEPFLLQEGFVKRTARGRVATEKSYQHLKIDHYPNALF